MGNIVIIDASVWVSSLVARDSNHQASLTWIEQYQAKQGILIVPSFFLIEVGGTLSRLTKEELVAKKAIQDIQAMQGMNIIAMDSAFIRLATQIAINLRLRAGDATYVALAHQLNIPLISWDKEQLERASSLVTTYTPDTYIFETDEGKAEEA